MAEQDKIFHARFGQWSDASTLVFGEPIDIPCNITPIVDEESPNDPKNQIQIATGIYAVGIAGMDDTGICLYLESDNREVRFQIGGFSWRDTPWYYYLRDRRTVLEITHDLRVDVDLHNEAYRRQHPPRTFEVTGKIYVFNENYAARVWPPKPI